MSGPFSLLRNSLSTVILALATLIGAWAFIYPFFFTQPQGQFGMTAHSTDAPLTFLALLTLCLVVIIANLETRQMDSKMVAILGILVAINSVLRLVPGPAGFSATFFLPILCGYAYGADFGFLLGALSMLVSAVVTGGLGPWLPYQMFSAGWMGMASASRPASLGTRGGGVVGRLGGAVGADLRSSHECLVLALCAGRRTRDVLAAGAEGVGDVGTLRRILSGDLFVVGRGAGWRESSAHSSPWGPRAALTKALPTTVYVEFGNALKIRQGPDLVFCNFVHPSSLHHHLKVDASWDCGVEAVYTNSGHCRSSA